MNDPEPIGESTPKGAPSANQLLPLVYDQLRQLASRKMVREFGTQTLQPTALVHEAWLRLGGDAQPAWENPSHFFCAAAEAMRRILIDRARKKSAIRHGGNQQRCNIDEMEIEIPCQTAELLAVHEVLDQFAMVEPKKAELVKLRYFGGMNLKDAGRILGISEPTAVRWWNYAKAWLFDAIDGKPTKHR